MTTTLYGITNCDTIRKARQFLDQHNVEYVFHDYRIDGTDKKLISDWVKTHGWETVLNKRGTTWRKLDDKTKTSVNQSNVSELLAEHPAMIKRPVLAIGKKSLVGFSKENYSEVLGL